MTAVQRTPENTGFLQPTKFLLTFDRIPNVTYFCQEVNIPGISLPAIVVPSPAIDYHVAGNKLTFSMMNIKFMVDSKVESWKSIYEWFMSMGSPHGTEERNLQTALQNQYKQSILTKSASLANVFNANYNFNCNLFGFTRS